MIERAHYDKLIESIDFFSQDLHFDQIVSYGYAYIHDLLKLDKSSVFVLKDGFYKAVHATNCDHNNLEILCTRKHKEIATRYGRIIEHNLEAYFDATFVKQCGVQTVIPLLVRDEMVGFIATNTKLSEVNGLEPSSLHATNQLLNNSLQIAMRFMEMKDLKGQLDRKIFNLFFINHSTKVLLSELDLEKLYQLCIDIIRELTSSSVTSFGLFDEHRDKIVIKGYTDVVSFNDYYCELELKQRVYTSRKIVFHVKKDRAELEEIFLNANEFDNLQAEYIVLIVKENVLGFVTIGDTIGSVSYDHEMFNQIKSIASSIYISITNAKYFKEINEQKIENQRKVDLIGNIMSSVKNINSCNTVEELSKVALNTMYYGFDFETAFIALNSLEGLKVVDSIGFDKDMSQMVNILKKEVGVFHFELNSDNLRYYLHDQVTSSIATSNCLVISPIEVDTLTCDESNIMGYIVVVKSKEPLKPLDASIVDMISSSIAPIIKKIRENEIIRKKFKPDQEALFLNELQEAIRYRESYYIDFNVYYKHIEKKPFRKLDIDHYKDLNVRQVDNMVLYIANDTVPKADFDGSLEVETVEGFIEQITEITG